MASTTPTSQQPIQKYKSATIHISSSTPAVVMEAIGALKRRGILANKTVEFMRTEEGFALTNECAHVFNMTFSKHPFVDPTKLDIVLNGDSKVLREAIDVMLNHRLIESAVSMQDGEIKVAYHTELNPLLWDKDRANYTLKQEVADKLLEAADSFMEFVVMPADIKIIDVTMTGSSANYNWTNSSDLDLHIVVDTTKVPAAYKELVSEYFKAKKTVWNDTHDISIFGIPVEFYVQDKDEAHHSTGVYSIQNEVWNIKPTHQPPEITDTEVLSKYNEAKRDIETACGSNKAAVIERVYEKIVKGRKAAVEKGGEFAVENIVFKLLRANGFVDKLADCKVKVFDRQLSIEDEEWVDLKS